MGPDHARAGCLAAVTAALEAFTADPAARQALARVHGWGAFRLKLVALVGGEGGAAVGR